MAETIPTDVTRAAIDFMLQGDGPSRCGTFVVTVRGGRIVSLQPVSTKISTETLVSKTQSGQFSIRKETITKE